MLLVERLVDAEPSADHARMDLFMLVLFGSGERSPAEFTALADAARLDIAATRPIGHGLSFIECLHLSRCAGEVGAKRRVRVSREVLCVKPSPSHR